MPGTILPKWFQGKSVSLSKLKKGKITGLIIGIILSINNNAPSELQVGLSGEVDNDIKANVLKLGKNIYSSMLELRGLPRTNEEHIYLCRFPDYHKLIPCLKHGDTFCVTKENGLVVKRLELKKCGVHLIFEGDDEDNDGDEELPMDRRRPHCVSEKLATFFNTYEDSPIDDDGRW